MKLPVHGLEVIALACVTLTSFETSITSVKSWYVQGLSHASAFDANGFIQGINPIDYETGEVLDCNIYDSGSAPAPAQQGPSCLGADYDYIPVPEPTFLAVDDQWLAKLRQVSLFPNSGSALCVAFFVFLLLGEGIRFLVMFILALLCLCCALHKNHAPFYRAVGAGALYSTYRQTRSFI
jgi:hypothetical protein